MAEVDRRADATPGGGGAGPAPGLGSGVSGDPAIALLGEINDSLRDMRRVLRITVAVFVLILVVLVAAALVISATAGQVQQRLGS